MLNLDKNRHYSFAVFPKLKFSVAQWAIIAKAKQTIKTILGINWSHYPTHSAMLVCEKDEWTVYESHWDTGVHKLSWEQWHAKNQHKFDFIEIYLEEQGLNLEYMKKHIGDPYARLDMLGFFNDFVFFKKVRSVLHKIDHGLFCTEYYANSTLDAGYLEWVGYAYAAEPATHSAYKRRQDNFTQIITSQM